MILLSLVFCKSLRIIPYLEFTENMLQYLHQTPYRRVLESSYVPEENKDQLRRLYAKLNPAELKRQITKLQNKLLNLKTA